MEKERTDYFIKLPELVLDRNDFKWQNGFENLQLSSNTLPEATKEAKEKFNERKKDLIDLINHPSCTLPKERIPEMENSFPKEIHIVEVSKYSVLV